MEYSQSRTIKIIAVLVLLAALSQPLYMILAKFAPGLDRKFLWGLEAFIFLLMATFAGSATGLSKRYTLGFSAILVASIFNVMQVGVGLTQFGSFGGVARGNPDLRGLMTGVVGYSFFGYNAAKMLIGFAAVFFGMVKIKDGSKMLGGAAVLVGLAAFIANALLTIFGIQGFVPRPVGGATGVAGALVLALCLFSIPAEED